MCPPFPLFSFFILFIPFRWAWEGESAAWVSSDSSPLRKAGLSLFLLETSGVGRLLITSYRGSNVCLPGGILRLFCRCDQSRVHFRKPCSVLNSIQLLCSKTSRKGWVEYWGVRRGMTGAVEVAENTSEYRDVLGMCFRDVSWG